jgi:hypothetical protein
MINDTLTQIEELGRIPSPCPAPIGLAWDGTDLWVASDDTQRLYGVRSNTGAVFEETTVPGDAVGITVTGDALRVLVADKDNSRTIRRYVFGHGFKASDIIACPDDTGSFLAYDGDNLFLSQRSLKRILELDGEGKVKRTIDVPWQITGMVVVHGCFYLMTTPDQHSEEHRLVRVDARKDTPQITELASVPFIARSIAWDGSKFWTNDRDKNAIVAFSPIGTP